MLEMLDKAVPRTMRQRMLMLMSAKSSPALSGATRGGEGALIT